MGGALQFDDPEDSVERLLTRLESVLAEMVGDDDVVTWCVLLNEQNTVAVRDPDDDVFHFEVTGELQEQIPEQANAVDEEGNLRLPVFPRLSHIFGEQMDYEDSLGHQEQLIDIYPQIREIDEVSLPPHTALQNVTEQQSPRGLTDAFGHTRSKLNSVLTVRLTEHSIATINGDDEIDIAISLDVFEQLLTPYQYRAVLLFYLDDERDEQVAIPVDYQMSADMMSLDSIPTADTVYIHQTERASVSGYNFTEADLEDLVRGRTLSYRGKFTVPDPSDRGLPATFGEIVQTDVETDTGFFYASPDTDVRLVHTYWAALDVPPVPYLTAGRVNDTSDWLSREFSGWTNLGNGFGLLTADEHRDIRQRIAVTGYWVVKGVNYPDKRDFKADLSHIEEILEAELDCEVERRAFNGTIISTTPIHQRDVVDQIVENVTEPPDADTLVRTTSFTTQQSTEVEGVDQPLYPSDLETFVADTNIIDAGVISTLVIDGQLYGSTVLVPDVVLEEVHRQADEGRRIGEDGLEELEYLRALADTDLIDFHVVETAATASEGGVVADHAILSVAQDQGVPLCSDDETLLRIAQVADVKTFQLKQELSQPKRLIKRLLSQHGGEMSIVELAQAVEAQREELTPSREYVSEQLFDSPDRVPSSDLSKEVAIRDLVDQMEHENTVYQDSDRVGLIENVCVVPAYAAVADGKVSEAVEEGELQDILPGPREAYNIRLALPAFLHEWASIQSNPTLEQEMEILEAMDQRHEIDIDASEPDLGYADILTVDEDYVDQALNGLIHRKRTDYETLFVLRYDPETDKLTLEEPA